MKRPVLPKLLNRTYESHKINLSNSIEASSIAVGNNIFLLKINYSEYLCQNITSIDQQATNRCPILPHRLLLLLVYSLNCYLFIQMILILSSHQISGCKQKEMAVKLEVAFGTVFTKL